MKLGFEANIIFNNGTNEKPATIVECFASLKRGELDIEYVRDWFGKPFIILTKKKK